MGRRRRRQYVPMGRLGGGSALGHGVAAVTVEAGEHGRAPPTGSGLSGAGTGPATVVARVGPGCGVLAA